MVHSPLDTQALPERDVLHMRMLLWIVYAVAVLGGLLLYAITLHRFAGPFVEYAGVWAVLVLLAGCVPVVWLAQRATWLLVRRMTAAECPACGGDVRLRRVRYGGQAYYMVLRCTGCGARYENFARWNSPYMGPR